MAKRKSTKGQTRSTKHTHKTKDRVTRTPLKTGVNLVGSSCSTSVTRCVNLATNLVISHERGKQLIYPNIWSRRDRDRIVVEYTTTYVIIVWHH